MDRKLTQVRAGSSHDFKKDKVIAGFLKKKEANQGEFKSSAFTIELESGDRELVWGNKIMDEQLKDIPLNAFIQIEFLGLKKSEKTGREYKDYLVSVDQSTVKASATEEELYPEITQF